MSISTLKHIATALALTGLILFVPANLLPFMTFETPGNKSEPTIYGGVVSLYETGSIFLAVVVFLASIVLPLLKILVIFWLLSPLGKRLSGSSFELTVTIFDVIGRWAMLDVFLLAIFIAIMKFGMAGRVTPGAGAVLFSVVVIATMIAYSAMDKLIKKPAQQDGTI